LDEVFTTMPSFYDLMPKSDIYNKENDKWIRDLEFHNQKFHDYLNEKPYWYQPSRNFAWMPSPFEECNGKRKLNYQKCGFYLYDYFKNPYLKTDFNGKKKKYFAAIDNDLK